MKILDEGKFAIQGLLARKGRSFLTILGIVIGVAGVITIIALGAGAQSLVLNQISKLGTNLIGVLPGKSNETGPPAQAFGVQITTLTTDDTKALKNKGRVPHLTDISGFVHGSGTIVYGNQNVDTTFTGVQASLPAIMNVEIEAGRFFSEQEEVGSTVMVLGYDVAEELFPEGDAMGKVVKIKNVPFQIIGVAKKQGTVAFENQDDQVYIPLNIAQTQLLGIKYLHFLRARVDDAANVPQTIEAVETVLKERHNIKTDEEIDFSVRDLADALQILTDITDALKLFLVAMAGIALLVGGIGIMNIMLVTVAERTREIGLRKALGATNRAVRNQFLLEASIVTLLGGIIGIILGVIIAFVVAMGAQYAGYDWAFIISPTSVVLAVGISILTGIIFGLYPAFKASRLNPIDALRYE